MSDSTCPQCAVFSEAINELVASSKKECEDNFLKKALEEIKLLNIRSYTSLIGSSLERAGDADKLPEGWKIISRQTWEDIQVMLYHIEDTVAALLPQDDAYNR